MKVQIDFEEYDNGISLKWEDLDGETMAQTLLLWTSRKNESSVR